MSNHQIMRERMQRYNYHHWTPSNGWVHSPPKKRTSERSPEELFMVRKYYADKEANRIEHAQYVAECERERVKDERNAKRRAKRASAKQAQDRAEWQARQQRLMAWRDK